MSIEPHILSIQYFFLFQVFISENESRWISGNVNYFIQPQKKKKKKKKKKKLKASG